MHGVLTSLILVQVLSRLFLQILRSDFPNAFPLIAAGVDTDIPTALEGYLITSTATCYVDHTLRKAIFMLCQVEIDAGPQPGSCQSTPFTLSSFNPS